MNKIFEELENILENAENDSKVSFDIDGTLIDSTNKIIKPTFDIFQKFKTNGKIKIFISTYRNEKFIEATLEQLLEKKILSKKELKKQVHLAVQNEKGIVKYDLNKKFNIIFFKSSKQSFFQTNFDDMIFSIGDLDHDLHLYQKIPTVINRTITIVTLHENSMAILLPMKSNLCYSNICFIL